MSIGKFDNIESDRLLLRRFRESDAECFLAYRTKPEVFRYQGEGWENYTFEQAVKFVKEQMDFGPGLPDTWFQIAIELKAEGRLIGDCAIHTLPHDLKQAEIGFTLDPIYQRRGYAAEAVSCLLGYIFKELDMHRVIAVADVRNEASVKLLQKLGMRREGHFIKNAWYRGEYTDEYLYAILKEEW